MIKCIYLRTMRINQHLIYTSLKAKYNFLLFFPNTI